MLPHKFLVLILACVEGASVLSLEIFAGQLLTPSFGDSVFKWLCVLIASMVGLTFGYWMAHRFAESIRGVKLPITLLVTGLCYEASVPLWFDDVLPRLIGLPGYGSIAIASACVVLAPMVLFGIVPCVLVALISTGEAWETPRSGRVFAASSMGGLLGGLVAGTLLIPAVGVTAAIRITAGTLMLLLIACQLMTGAKRESAFALCVWALVLLSPQDTQTPVQESETLLDYQEGILGQIAVVEKTINQTERQRVLYVNRMPQSVYQRGAYLSSKVMPSYVRESLPIVATYPKGAEVLLLGLGGGSRVHVMRQLDFNVTVVELDQRIVEVAKRHFDAPRDAEYVLDDARRYIRRGDRAFDIIFFDVYRGEYPPTHMFTVESLRELERALRPQGVVLINVAGRIDSPDSETVRSFIKTIRAAGFRCRAVQGQPSLSTLLVVDRGDRENVRDADPSVMRPFGNDERLVFFDDSTVSYDNAYVFTDDKPILEALYRADARRFRENINARYLERRDREPVPLFR